MALDAAQLTAILHATGGPHNPFSTFYLAHLALAAVALPPVWTALIAGLCCAGFGLLFVGGTLIPRPGEAVCGVGPSLPLRIHLQGMLAAFVLTALAIVFFAGRLQQALRRREQQLAEIRGGIARHERFVALATLAAGAAHELGTPLATISIAAGEVERSARRIPGQEELVDDAELIREEVARCRSILDRLESHSGDSARDLSVQQVLEQVRMRFSNQLITQDTSEALGVHGPPEALVQALSCLVKNGLDARLDGTQVVCRVEANDQSVQFLVENLGSPLSDAARTHAGEPFFTTKPPGQGTGLGLFLVRLLADRVGGEFRIWSDGGNRTTAMLMLPRSKLKAALPS